MPRITLRAARVNKGLDQKEAAKALKISNKTLQSWEAGRTAPKQSFIDPICELYGLSYDDIIFSADNPL